MFLHGSVAEDRHVIPYESQDLAEKLQAVELVVIEDYELDAFDTASDVEREFGLAVFLYLDWLSPRCDRQMPAAEV